MQSDISRALSQETAAFYAAYAESFSHTREHGWQGFDLLLPYLPTTGTLRLIDIAAGNARFEGSLSSAKPELLLDATLIDITKPLLDQMNTMAKEAKDTGQLTIKEQLLDLSNPENLPELEQIITNTKASLIVCYGYMHHLFDKIARKEFIETIAKAALPDTLLAFSFWAPLENERLAKKAVKATPLALEKLSLQKSDLEAGDIFLDWQADKKYFRYIHSFNAQEVEGIEELLMKNKCFICENSQHDTNNYYIIAQKRN